MAGSIPDLVQPRLIENTKNETKRKGQKTIKLSEKLEVQFATAILTGGIVALTGQEAMALLAEIQALEAHVSVTRLENESLLAENAHLANRIQSGK